MGPAFPEEGRLAEGGEALKTPEHGDGASSRRTGKETEKKWLCSPSCALPLKSPGLRGTRSRALGKAV